MTPQGVIFYGSPGFDADGGASEKVAGWLSGVGAFWKSETPAVMLAGASG